MKTISSKYICGKCGLKEKKIKGKCQGCSLIYYCSKECQLADWKEHKKMCPEYKLCLDIYHKTFQKDIKTFIKSICFYIHKTAGIFGNVFVNSVDGVLAITFDKPEGTILNKIRDKVKKTNKYIGDNLYCVYYSTVNYKNGLLTGYKGLYNECIILDETIDIPFKETKRLLRKWGIKLEKLNRSLNNYTKTGIPFKIL